MESVFTNVDIDALQGRENSGSDRWRLMKMSGGRWRGRVSHLEDPLHIHGGDEAFALLIKLVEALLVSDG